MSHKENLSVSNAKHKSVVILMTQPDFLSLGLSLLYHNCLYIVYNCYILFRKRNQLSEMDSFSRRSITDVRASLSCSNKET